MLRNHLDGRFEFMKLFSFFEFSSFLVISFSVFSILVLFSCLRFFQGLAQSALIFHSFIDLSSVFFPTVSYHFQIGSQLANDSL